MGVHPEVGSNPVAPEGRKKVEVHPEADSNPVEEGREHLLVEDIRRVVVRSPQGSTVAEAVHIPAVADIRSSVVADHTVEEDNNQALLALAQGIHIPQPAVAENCTDPSFITPSRPLSSL